MNKRITSAALATCAAAALLTAPFAHAATTPAAVTALKRDLLSYSAMVNTGIRVNEVLSPSVVTKKAGPFSFTIDNQGRMVLKKGFTATWSLKARTYCISGTNSYGTWHVTQAAPRTAAAGGC